MSKISKLLKKTDLMNINIKYGEQKIRFNLKDELAINENQLNKEISQQPSHYGFLLILLNKLDKVKKVAKADLDKLEGKLYKKYKSDIDPNTNRPYSKEVAEAMVKTNKEFITTLKTYYKLEEEYGSIKSCVAAFEQRSFLIQSLSANIRNEKNNY